MISSSELIAKVKSYHPEADESLIQKAYIFAKTSHGNQKRHSGDLYFSHPLAVAEILTELKLDQESIMTGLLHDVVEDTDVTIDDIEEKFGSDVARLVDGVTKLGKIENIPVNERVADNFRKLTIAMSQDIRVLLVKLSDRLHNMRTLFYMPSLDRKIKKAQECLDIYAPLAARIGLNKVRDELQELAFEIIDPDAREHIVGKLNEIHQKNKNLIDKIVVDFKELFALEGLSCEVYGREKKPYSIFNKMKEKKVGFHNLNDIMAFRVVVKDVAQCYQALGIINSTYSMIPDTFKDYISLPKENGYRSLHLAILGPFNKKIEIQIRDEKMHESCELGLAAHWCYKEKANKLSIKEHEGYKWIRELISLFEKSESSSEVLKNHKFTMHQNEVFCFTPDGDIFNLPFGSTVIDFAYAIHSEVGNGCISGKVNGIISPLRQKIENGDQVEITTSKKAKPSPNWLQFAVTSKAKSSIRHFIRSQKAQEYQELGKAILTKFFESKNYEINDKILEKTLEKLQVKNITNLYIKVGEGITSRYDVLKAAYPDFKEEAQKSKNLEIVTKEKDKKTVHKLSIEGLVPGMAIHYGGCCNPIPGDPIVGVINTGTGVTIHNQRCKNFKNLALLPQRVLDVCWKNNRSSDGENFNATILATVHNESGSLADISNIIAKKNVNITNIKLTNRSADYFDFLIDIEIKNIDHLEDIISSLRISKKIVEVSRFN